MSLNDATNNPALAKEIHTPPTIVVGNGPVGMRAVTELLDRLPKMPIVIYGEETHPPYDRVRLSSWLSGELSMNSFVKPFRRPFGSKVDERYGYRVTSIDPETSTVTDSAGVETQYSHLILATGSRAFIPEIEGITLDGVYSLRNLDDATQLMSRRVRSRHTVVIGGGLLGLETARGMQPTNTKVTIVEHADRLMANQLDEEAAALLKSNVEAMGFNVVVGDGIKAITGSPRVEGVQLRSGPHIPCDTVIVATGIRPNIDLAKPSVLPFARGIKVDDQMQTSVRNVYAVGECAEHRGEVYGLVAPGFEQASVAANTIAGQEGMYTGSMAASRLKVVGMDVFSVGPMGHEANPLTGTSVCYRSKKTNSYRKILIKQHRVIGAIGMGSWEQTVRLQSAIAQQERVFPWQTLRFKLNGDLWGDSEGSEVAQWAEQTIVCQCKGVSRGKISAAIDKGATDVDSVGRACGAGTVCGSCKPLVSSLLGQTAPIEPIGGLKPLVALTAASVIALLLVLLSPIAPYADSVQPLTLFGKPLSWHWDSLWRVTLNKQITGFTILGAAVAASLFSFRKRIKKLHSIAKFDSWRIAHLALSLVALFALLLHTGFRMGHGLNFALMSLFVALAVLGCLSAAVMSLEHKLPRNYTAAVKRHSMRLHIYLVWPIPVLLGWHILKGYWY